MAFDYALTIEATSGTVTLTSSPWQVAEWQPRLEPRDEETVAEEIDVRVRDSSVAENLNEMRVLNRLLEQAERAQINPAVEKVYVTWKESASGEKWRSEVKNGRAMWSDTATRKPYWDAYSQFGRVFVERANFWEGTLTQIPLTNTNGTANTNGLTVLNCADTLGTVPTLNVNWVEIAGTAVLGDLPAACKLMVQNTTNDSAEIAELWVGHNIYSNPSAPGTLLYEAETASGPTPAADASCSGTAYASYSLTNSLEVSMYTWTIAAAEVDKFKGWFRALARFQAENTDVYYRAKVGIPSSTTYLSTGPQVKPGAGLKMVDMGLVKIPPWKAGLSSQRALSLVVSGQRSTSDTETVALDCLFLLPVDGYRHYDLASTAEYEYSLIDDGTEGYTYIEDGSSAMREADAVMDGEPIKLIPNTTQRLYFFHITSTGASTIDRTSKIKLYYRPRRLTL